MFYISEERIKVENCTYVGDRNLTSREDVVELFANTSATYLNMTKGPNSIKNVFEMITFYHVTFAY